MNKKLFYLLISICIISPLIFISIRKIKSLKHPAQPEQTDKVITAVDNLNDTINTDLQKVVNEVAEEAKIALGTKTDMDDTKELTDKQKTTMLKLTSLFENGTFDLQYSYIENLDDGRGYTAGIGGFTSADGEIYDVAELYTQKKPINKLVKYLPELKKLKRSGSDETSKLKDFTKAWQDVSTDSKFLKAQDELVDKLYFKPAMEFASDNGINTALGKAFIYDTMIQHGDGDDPDSLPSIIKKTNKSMNGNPKSGIDEKAWIYKMIDVRRKVLENASDEDTREVWKESVGRCDVFKNIANSVNFDLTTPIKIKTGEYDETLN